MRFYEISEAILDPKKAAEYTKHIDMPKALAIAQTHCSDALNVYLQTGKALFKGFPSWTSGEKFENNFYAIDSSQIARRSQNTSNIYTFFISKVSQAWKQYPPRDRALICSSSVNYAKNYGTIFCLFPENGTKIGVCSSYDMWESFEGGHIGSLGDFASFLNLQMFKWLQKQQLIPMDAKSWDYGSNTLDKYIPEFLKLPLSTLSENDENYYGINRFSKNMSIGQYMEQVLDPTTNDFNIASPKQIAHIPGSGEGAAWSGSSNEGRECWFSGRCVVANKAALDMLIKKGEFK